MDLYLGYNRHQPKGRLPALWLGLEATFDLTFKKMDKAEKINLIEIIKKHHINRSKVALKDSNEVVLFVISPEFQGKGVGTQLWLVFRAFCSRSIESTIQVETNKTSASRFYKKLGFRHKTDFDSPLHNLATKGRQACIYEYIQNKPAPGSDHFLKPISIKLAMPLSIGQMCPMSAGYGFAVGSIIYTLS